MAFFNEWIPEEERKKHRITPENDFYRAGATSWTIDRDRNVFLVKRVSPGPESPPGQVAWAFYWRGTMLDVWTKTLETGEDAAVNRGWVRKKILSIKGMTPELESQRAEILEDLRQAFVALQELGVHSPFPPYTRYEVVLEI